MVPALATAWLARRTVAVSAGATVAAVVAGCGSTAVPSSTGPDRPDTTVQNAYIVPARFDERCAIRLDRGADMRFTVTNNREAQHERLLGATTGAARTATLTPDGVDIPRRTTVGFGEPDIPTADLGRVVQPVRLDGLDPDLRPATSTEVTFSFERAGNITLPVPVQACPRRAGSPGATTAPGG